jgi:hypothetical protein
MFGVPERHLDNETITFHVPVKTPIRLGLRLQAPKAKSVVPDIATASVFQELRVRALTELMNTSQLFKNKPTFESLDSITPKWGVVYQESAKKTEPSWSSYTKLVFDSTLTYPCVVDLELGNIQITRSTISPTFHVVFVEAQTKQVPLIDFEWPAKQAQAQELEEVNDIPAADKQTGVLHLRDPAQTEQEKADAKDYVRSLFRTADEARMQALDAMRAFFETYTPADDESNFSEWMADDRSESGPEDVEDV